MMTDISDGWLPRLVDIRQLRNSDDEETAEYYSQFGFDKLVIPATCTNVTARFSDLTVRFNERYDLRRINQETMERWQVRLQNRMDEVVDEFERAYALYTQYANDMRNKVITGTTTSVSSSDAGTSSSSGSESATGKSIATPDSAINEDDDYADSLTKSSGSSSSTGRTSNNHMSSTTLTVNGDVIGDINRNIFGYKDIDTEFIKCFEDNFLNVFDY